MQINCSYCNCPMEATSEKCPHCGGTNEKASKYINHHEAQMRLKSEAREEAFRSVQNVQAQAKKIVAIVYGSLAVIFAITIMFGVIASVNAGKRKEQERIEKERVKQEQLKEEQRLQEEQEKEKAEYDNALVMAKGLNESVEKDRYYSIQVSEVVPYELSFDHNPKYWAENMVDDPLLVENEHRLAIHISLKNYQDEARIYNNPTDFTRLYIEDENGTSIVVQENKLLNGSSDDNYYSGGKMISDTPKFVDNFGNKLVKNQTMSWWVPVVVNENSKEINIHFDYNMVITIDNPFSN